MSNLIFFKTVLESELKATSEIITALPFENIHYRPHERSRSAYQISEHIIAHAFDFIVILNNSVCDECLVMPFSSSLEGSVKLEQYWNETVSILNDYDEDRWNNEMVELQINGNTLLSLPRANMMWFFLFDIIHHRGQLSTYIRPMGGKNPAVYGFSADTV
jgi:uncharacterized damage-inducible protein DinB